MYRQLTGVLAASLTLLLCGCGDLTDCSARLSFMHTFPADPDEVCDSGACMGDDGANFNITSAGVVRTVSDNSCPGAQDGSQSHTAAVERSGDTLIISLGTEEVSLELTGNEVTQTRFELESGGCLNVGTNISGMLDYSDKTLVWSYDLQVTDIGGCF